MIKPASTFWNTRSRQERLTDLLVEAKISQVDFDVRKRNSEFELQMLRNEMGKLEAHQKAEDDLGDLLAMTTDMGTVFAVADQPEQRSIIKNCIQSLFVGQAGLMLQPADWLKTLRTMKNDQEFTPTPEAFGLLCSGSRHKVTRKI